MDTNFKCVQIITVNGTNIIAEIVNESLEEIAVKNPFIIVSASNDQKTAIRFDQTQFREENDVFLFQNSFIALRKKNTQIDDSYRAVCDAFRTIDMGLVAAPGKKFH